MFAVGDYVVKALNGICRVDEIGHPDMDGANPDKLYYFLVPEKGKGSRLYLPVEMGDEKLRPALTKEEAMDLIRGMDGPQSAFSPDKKKRDQEMKVIINGNDPRETVRLLKYLYADRQKRLQGGKKIPALEERYFRQAEEQLNSELAFALGKDPADLPEFIRGEVSGNEN